MTMLNVLRELEQSAAMHESNARTCERFRDDDGREMALSRAAEYRGAIEALTEHLRQKDAQAKDAAAGAVATSACRCKEAQGS